MRNLFWGILGLFLLAALVLLAGCAAEGGYQRSEAGYYQAPENRFEYKYYRAPTSGGAMSGPPPEAG
jgi:ABC-type oligopeptide transport system substrate-binding subunit